MAIPTDIAGLYAWYRASSLSGYGNGDTISGGWPDSSGNGRTLSPTVAGGYPKFAVGQIAGYPAVDFRGGGYFSNSGFGWLVNSTIFVVFLTSNNTAQNPVFVSAGGFAAEGFRAGPGQGATSGHASAVVQIDNFPWTYAASQALSLNIWHYGYCAQTASPMTNVKLSLDGAVESVTALSGTRVAPSAACYMNTDGGGSWAAGFVAEVVVYSGDLSSGNKALINAYLRDKYFGAAPGQNEQIRDTLSRRLWLRRRPGGLLEVRAPLWALDADILDRVALESRTGPAPAAAGWRAKKWQRRAFTKQHEEVDFASRTVKLILLDRRPLDVLLWDTARTDVVNSSARQGGVARLTKGVGFTFSRQSQAWIPNPADPTACIACAQNERAINQDGELLEEARTNQLLRSSFVSGTAGLTLTGTATNGSSIDADTTDLFFDQATSPNSLEFTAGNPHSAILQASFPVTASFPASAKVFLSIDHKTDSGEPLGYALQRSSDGLWYRQAGDTWAAYDAALSHNSLGTVSARNPASRVIVPITLNASPNSLYLYVRLQSGGLASRVSHLYHAQIEQGSFPTSRIVTDGAAVTRVKTQLSHEVTTALKLYDPALGAFWCQFVPDWSSSELGSTEDQYLYYMETNGGADRQALYYDASAGAWVFESKVGGSTVTASKTATVTRGTVYAIGCRWTGAEGELDLTPYTVSVFVDGVKGTDAVSAAPTFTSPETLYRGSDASFAKQANGAVREVRIFPYAPTDEEMGALP
jgi:hypothetical protein